MSEQHVAPIGQIGQDPSLNQDMPDPAEQRRQVEADLGPALDEYFRQNGDEMVTHPSDPSVQTLTRNLPGPNGEPATLRLVRRQRTNKDRVVFMSVFAPEVRPTHARYTDGPTQEARLLPADIINGKYVTPDIPTDDTDVAELGMAWLEILKTPSEQPAKR